MNLNQPDVIRCTFPLPVHPSIGAVDVINQSASREKEPLIQNNGKYKWSLTMWPSNKLNCALQLIWNARLETVQIRPWEQLIYDLSCLALHWPVLRVSPLPHLSLSFSLIHWLQSLYIHFYGMNGMIMNVSIAGQSRPMRICTLCTSRLYARPNNMLIFQHSTVINYKTKE